MNQLPEVSADHRGTVRPCCVPTHLQAEGTGEYGQGIHEFFANLSVTCQIPSGFSVVFEINGNSGVDVSKTVGLRWRSGDRPFEPGTTFSISESSGRAKYSAGGEVSVFDLIGADGVRRPFTGDIEDWTGPPRIVCASIQAEATAWAWGDPHGSGGSTLVATLLPRPPGGELDYDSWKRL